MTTAEQLKHHIEATDSPIRVVEISPSELNDRSHDLEGRFGWLAPRKVQAGLHTEWHADVCFPVIEQQMRLADLGRHATDAYLQGIAYWMTWHVVYNLDGIENFAEREAKIEAHAADVAPEFIRVISEIQMRILERM